jgi:hypothetical protein
MTLDPAALTDWLERAGLLGALVFILVGGAKRLWVWGWYAEEMRLRLERAEQQRDAAIATARGAVTVAEKVVP